MAIGMVRYHQELLFGCYADPDVLPEVQQLPALIEAELQELGPRCDARSRPAMRRTTPA
jgi:diacylglycerol O-acyltransferase / wax synthase